ncbi:pupal cuticle protein C1B [Drosophila tropicalis]|uniref:pupal cuticle protein C1B n=1 Tax=Drosophila tropicalis TaxID=46794 RepID=UPI0035AB8CE9
MFKFFAFCLLAVVACVAAKPAVLATPFAYSAYSSPLVAASPYTAAYTSAAYTAPVAAAYSAYSYPYASAYSAYPYASYYR